MPLEKQMMSKDSEAVLDRVDTTTVGEVEDLLGRVGTAAADELDDAILRANGHEAVLQRQFRWFSAFGLAFSITNSWIGYLVRLISAANDFLEH